MQSLVGRLESRGLDTSRDISDLRGHIVSQLSRIDISLDAISRSLVVLHDRIESTARKMETFESSVNSLLKQKEEAPVMNSQGSSGKTPLMDVEELPDTPITTLVRSTSPDITCYETIGLCKHQKEDPIFLSDGYMESQEWENLEELMKHFQTPM